MPTGPGPRLAGRVLNGTTFSLLGLLPPLLVAALLIEAAAPAVRILGGVALVMIAGGLFMPPEVFPPWLNTLSTMLPSRAARDLVVSIVTGDALPAMALPVLLAWTVVFAALTVYAYRRDEGRRFR